MTGPGGRVGNWKRERREKRTAGEAWCVFFFFFGESNHRNRPCPTPERKSDSLVHVRQRRGRCEAGQRGGVKHTMRVAPLNAKEGGVSEALASSPLHTPFASLFFFCLPSSQLATMSSDLAAAIISVPVSLVCAAAGLGLFKIVFTVRRPGCGLSAGLPENGRHAATHMTLGCLGPIFFLLGRGAWKGRWPAPAHTSLHKVSSP